MKKIILYLFVFTYSVIKAQDIPFNCEFNAYLFQYNDIYAIDLASGNMYTVATDITPENINAAAYNPDDGFIWGSLSSTNKEIVRIGKNFQTSVYTVPELPTNSRYVGDVSAAGVYYLKGGGTTYYKIDLDVDPNTVPATTPQHLATLTLSQNLSIHDWAFNSVDGMLYTVEKGTNILYRITADTGAVEALGEVPILSGQNYTYGAVYFDAAGFFYVSANQTGTIYVIKNVQNLNSSSTMDSNLFAFGPSSASNDGARCPTAPVPQEDCINGVDDDGDGLIDCDDPSCSGYASCPVIDPPTSGGNSGGLESNNRLSEQINKRNFNRAKSNYMFDATKAKRFSKSSKYGRLSNKTLQLSDFIPAGIVKEDHAVESSPSDLLNITNASQIYAVDYMRNNKPIASILALKTENGVYEHTKYICDRLLGAELISVSTIDINGQQFIKSIIKNTEGNTEFVLSLSAKAIDNNTNFSIESHWNLDKYEKNVPFYNFQIWANSVDNLLLLSEEVIKLLNVQKPIVAYNNSTPPTVFVRKGTYRNGKLDLQIINTNATESVTLDAGVRATETSEIDYTSSTLSLNRTYFTKKEVDAGNLFDIGFRIGDGKETPDDLFMSDGPWGYDDAASSTIVTKYNVESNTDQFNNNEFPIERNIQLTATTSDYIAAYRALTPKFNPVNLSAYNSFQLSAKGTGNLVIRLIKKGVDNWESQYKATIALKESLQDYSIPFSEFKSDTNQDLVLNDITSIVFTMVSENGNKETKEMDLQQLRFSTNNQLSVNDLSVNNLSSQLVAIPNPMNSSTVIYFTAQQEENVTLMIYNQLGALVKEVHFQARSGKNEITLEKNNLESGFYFSKIKSKHTDYKTIKLFINK